MGPPRLRRGKEKGIRKKIKWCPRGTEVTVDIVQRQFLLTQMLNIEISSDSSKIEPNSILSNPRNIHQILELLIHRGGKDLRP